MYVASVNEGEMTIADDTYRDRNYFICPTYNPESNLLQKKIMARHERINGRIKSFRVLTTPFRHNLDLHPTCFLAVANLVQLQILNKYEIDLEI